MPIWEYEIVIIDVAKRKAQLDAFGLVGWKLFKLFPAGGRRWEAILEREVVSPHPIEKIEAISSTERRCQKCGSPTKGEEAYVDGQFWCHPCADNVALPSTDRNQP